MYYLAVWLSPSSSLSSLLLLPLLLVFNSSLLIVHRQFMFLSFSDYFLNIAGRTDKAVNRIVDTVAIPSLSLSLDPFDVPHCHRSCVSWYARSNRANHHAYTPSLGFTVYRLCVACVCWCVRHLFSVHVTAITIWLSVRSFVVCTVNAICVILWCCSVSFSFVHKHSLRNFCVLGLCVCFVRQLFLHQHYTIFFPLDSFECRVARMSVVIYKTTCNAGVLCVFFCFLNLRVFSCDCRENIYREKKSERTNETNQPITERIRKRKKKRTEIQK